MIGSGFGAAFHSWTFAFSIDFLSMSSMSVEMSILDNEGICICVVKRIMIEINNASTER